MCLVALSFGLFANCSDESGSGSGSGGNGNNSAYVDLGLPSGTKWKTQNEGVNANAYYTFDEAISRFGNQVPSQTQWIELRNQCNWYWNGEGFTIVGPNGNSIDLPAQGRNYNYFLNGYYWSSTSTGSESASLLFFDDGTNVYMFSDYRDEALSVRLVQQGR